MSSVVALIEVERTAWRIGRSAIARAHLVLPRIALVELDDEVVRTAASIKSAELRTLDAIHLATALLVRDRFPELALATHDEELAIAARAVGFHVHGAPTRARFRPVADWRR